MNAMLTSMIAAAQTAANNAHVALEAAVASGDKKAIKNAQMAFEIAAASLKGLNDASTRGVR